MWPFTSKKKKARRELKNLANVFAIFDEMERRGLVFWKPKDNILLIEEQLAQTEMFLGKKKFHDFLDKAAQWQNYRLFAEAYERQRIEVETQAVREAQAKEGRVLVNADIQRIRLHARQQHMTQVLTENVKPVHEFDIMIIRASATSAAEATEENGLLLALGHYDGEQLEMAMYDDIKASLQGEGDNDKEGKA